LSAKVGNWAIGLLTIDDRTLGSSFGTEEDSGQGSPRTRIGVVRIQRDFGRESNAGFLVTSDRAGSRSNEVYSADGRYKLNAHWILTGQLMRSETVNGDDGTNQSGSAYFGEVRHSGKHFSYYTQYRDRSPEFRSDLGYIPRVDIRQFTRSLSVRAILDYNAVLPNERLVDLERQKRINLDFLATYMPHPGTAVYIGYGDRYENVLPPWFQRVGIPGFSTGRQVFVKVSYLIRLRHRRRLLAVGAFGGASFRPGDPIQKPMHRDELGDDVKPMTRCR
jgi:hypothetical protein